MCNNSDNGIGKVWLVGAGPSDPGLFTLRGQRVLREAEVVLYDALAGQGIAAMIPEQAERVYVGKRSASHSVPQAQINQLLLDYALAGKRVVRLKGGDPFLFGRGGEELELLAEHGIPFEVVPGVSSALAVPAYQGIPVTHRDVCSSVHIITGHAREGSVSHIDFEALVRTEGTLVFLMGVSSLEGICRGLLDAGMDPDVPAALLMRGTTARQERIRASVGTLPEEAARRGAKPPAVIVVGEVCALADRFSWYEKMPLGGVRILLTQPRERACRTVERLRTLGAETVLLPTIRTVRRENNTALREALHCLEQYQWIVFTSPTGVRIFFEEMRDEGMDVRRLGKSRIAAMGNGTGRELKKRGLYPDLMPEIYDGEHLGQALAKAGWPGEHVLIPRAAAGNRELTDAISHMEVDDIPIYDTVYAEPDAPDGCLAELRNGAFDYVIFTSASCVRGLVSMIGHADSCSAEGKSVHGGKNPDRPSAEGKSGHAGENPDRPEVQDVLSGIKAVCIGEQTAREAGTFGMQTYVSEKADTDSLVELLCVVNDPSSEDNEIATTLFQ
ncbi:MAG: uroporphyrinogen-III C-methyltransferase [Lachnospiraceae bacterium]|nr:uroporphyrinogen-III C-methyltransferase [Lachnospiraceae bacterium]